MTDSPNLDETETKVLLLMDQLMMAFKMEPSEFMAGLDDSAKVKIFADCMSDVGLNFLNYISPPQDRGKKHE